MSTAIARYDRVQDPIGFAEKMAKPFAALIGCSIDQGAAIALTCLCEGITPLDCQRKYHFIQGKPSMKADAMLAEFRTTHGGKHKVIERSPERAAIELTDATGQKMTAELSWEEIQQSRWPWRDPNDHSKGLKDNWSTPTDRRSMLWARLVSDSLRSLCPEIVAGVYTPEEMADSQTSNEAMHREVVSATVKPTVEEVMRKNADRKDGIQDGGFEDETESAPVARVDDSPPFDASFEVVDETHVLGPGFGTKAQIERINQLYRDLQVPYDRQQAALEKRNANHLRNLTKDQAQEILDKLEAVERQRLALGN